MLYVSDSLEAAARVLVDPNGKRDDATIALSQWVPSPDGKLLAYALSDGGTRLEHLALPPRGRWRRPAGGAQVQQVLAGLLGARQLRRLLQPLSAQGRASRPKAERGDDAGRPDVFFHKLDEAQSADRLVYQVTDHPTRVPSAQVTEDGRYLIIDLFDGYEPKACWCRICASPAPSRSRCSTAWDALYNFLGSKGDELYFQTTNDAPRGRVIAVDAHDPQPAQWRTVVPQSAVLPSATPPTSAAASWSSTRATRAASCGSSRRAAIRRARCKLPASAPPRASRAAARIPKPSSRTPTILADAHAAPRRRDEYRERVPHAERARGFLAVRDRAGVLHSARTARACRCSSRAARMRRATAISP